MLHRPELRIETGEWLELSLTIIICFFDYFELSNFFESYNFDPYFEMKNNFDFDVKLLILHLHEEIKNLIDVHLTRLGSTISQVMSFALNSLGQHIHNELEGLVLDINESNEFVDVKLKVLKAHHQRSSIIFEDVKQIYYKKQYKIFTDEIIYSTKRSVSESVYLFDSIPLISERCDSDVRFEPLVEKLTKHLRSIIKKTSQSRSLFERESKSTFWLLKALRRLFENKSGNILILNIKSSFNFQAY
jgi:hypothetical protein